MEFSGHLPVLHVLGALLSELIAGYSELLPGSRELVLDYLCSCSLKLQLS